MDKIIGMGNALVDVLVTLQGDALLDEMNLPKGSMQLIDEAKFLKIRNKFADVKTHKATGGSAGNTVLALANLGAQPGFIGKIGKDDFGQYHWCLLKNVKHLNMAHYDVKSNSS